MVEPDQEFVVRDDGRSISYGPFGDDREGWVLRVGTVDGERVDLVLGEHAMYELWTEVQNVPWPRDPQEPDTGELVHRLVEKANGADEAMLRAALAALVEEG
ncbi:MAG: hypothetical protein ABEH77_04125, partial [Halobacteriaceae archaeon]